MGRLGNGQDKGTAAALRKRQAAERLQMGEGWQDNDLVWVGAHPKVVQERHGQANIGITLDTYSHVTGGLHGEAAERVAGIILGGAQ